MHRRQKIHLPGDPEHMATAGGCFLFRRREYYTDFVCLILPRPLLHKAGVLVEDGLDTDIYGRILPRPLLNKPHLAELML